MSTPERVRTLVEPLVAELHLDLYDLDYAGGVLRVVVSQPGGVGMDAITALTKAISRAVDEHDPIPDGFTLEVSSPGLERPLRTPAHFAGAIGTAVAVKTLAGSEGARRVSGTLQAADDTTITISLDDAAGESRTIAYDHIERARTVFAWGPTPKPGKAPKPGSSPKTRKTPRAEASSRPSKPDATSLPNEEKVPAP